jgi:hypothetical protein
MHPLRLWTELRKITCEFTKSRSHPRHADQVLLGSVRAEAQARRMDPRLAYLVQAPHMRILRQGVCDRVGPGRA